MVTCQAAGVSIDRVHRVALVIAAGLALSACGDTPRPTTQPRVSIKLASPNDGGAVRSDRVEVRGTVSPADSAVRVLGEEAQVEAGEFRAEVALDPGGNVIDVTATAPGRRPATDALRVVRDTRVEVPGLVGAAPEQAADELRAAGLEPEEERSGSWIDRLLPGDIQVCETQPAAGAFVEKGTRVTLFTAREC